MLQCSVFHSGWCVSTKATACPVKQATLRIMYMGSGTALLLVPSGTAAGAAAASSAACFSSSRTTSSAQHHTELASFEPTSLAVILQIWGTLSALQDIAD